MMFHSQYGQDKYIYEHFFQDTKKGIFVEFGALDGLLDSNTLFFEQHLDWSGVLVEPNPVAFALLQANRPRCKVENVAISDTNQPLTFTQIHGGLYGWSGLEDDLEPQHRERIRTRISPDETESITVEAHDLRWLAEKHDLHHVDLMSIDVEGSEAKIMESFPWDLLVVSVLCIENNFGNYDIDDLMTQKGYSRVARVGTDDIYATRDLI